MGQINLVDRVRDQLASAPPSVVAAYLFGSVATGRARSDSDIDLGILTRGNEPATLDSILLDYEAALSRSLERIVQVVVLDHAPLDLVHRVMRDGRVLLDRDRAARLRFEVRSRNLYFDFLPTLRHYRAVALAKAAAERAAR